MRDVSDPELEAAWAAVHDALPTGWFAVRPMLHAEERERPWHVVAVDYRTSSRRHDRVEATGRTEAEALRDLAGLLRLWMVEKTGRQAPA
jgi:hypothetical protein